MVVIYVLELKDKKYYIGKSANLKNRIDQHFNSNGSSWTKKYHPIKVVETINNCDNFDEDKITLKYMSKFGIDNVRGGSFCEITLSHDNISTIQKMIQGSQDKCYNCGRFGHFANECDENSSIVFKIIKGIIIGSVNFFSYLLPNNK